jgi:two-component system sensor histidine kinase KdpD
MIEDSRYLITLAIFLVVSFLISSLMQKLHKEAQRAIEGEEKTDALYNVAKALLSVSGPKRINRYFSNIIYQNTQYRNYIFMDNEVYTSQEESTDYQTYKKDIDFAVKTSSHIGIGTAYKPTLPYRIIGIAGITGHRVALLIAITEETKQYELDFISAIINLYKIVMQKEVAKLDEENSRLIAENERFKNQILRSISHDLRTPLTSILTGSSLLYNDIDVSEKMRKEIVFEIMDEVDAMTLLIDNILQMTKFQNREVLLHKSKELVDDLVSQAASNIQRRLRGHTLHINRSDEVIMISVDSKLIIQVLTNLLDNAIQHTNEDSTITIDYGIEQTNLHLKVSDNGGGINEQDFTAIFDSEYTNVRKKDTKRGFGLGLNICKAIVEKHNGTIMAYNNENNGATFEMILPL